MDVAVWNKSYLILELYCNAPLQKASDVNVKDKRFPNQKSPLQERTGRGKGLLGLIFFVLRKEPAKNNLKSVR